MTKHQKNRNILLNVIQIFLLLIIGLLQYFQYKKMGVQRTLVYYNYYLEKDYNIKIFFTIIAIILLLVSIYIAIKNKKFTLSILLSIIILLINNFEIEVLKFTKYGVLILLIVMNILELIKGDKK